MTSAINSLLLYNFDTSEAAFPLAINMIVCLSCLRSLLGSFQHLPDNVEASKELLWESSVFRKEITAAVAQPNSKIDDRTLLQLLSLAAEVADQLICVRENLLLHWQEDNLSAGLYTSAISTSDEDALSAACLNAAAAAEVTDGLLSLLAIPALQDVSLAHRLAASSIIVLQFCVPRAALERGLVSSSVLEVVTGTTRRAVEMTAEGHGTGKPTAQLERWVCRPLVLHSFILQAVHAIEIASACKACKGPVDKRLQRAREHLVYMFHAILTSSAFQAEAKGILSDVHLLQRVNTQVAAWQQYILDHGDSRSADWHSHIKVIDDVQQMPCLQHVHAMRIDDSYATMLSSTDEFLSELGSCFGEKLRRSKSSSHSSKVGQEEEEVRAARSALRKLRHYTSLMHEFGVEDDSQ